MLGNHGVGKCNANKELLLALCSEYNLVVTNILIKHKDTHSITYLRQREVMDLLDQSNERSRLWY